MCEKNNPTTAFVSWSDWDFGVCLTKECERKRIKRPQYFDQWIDLKATFKVKNMIAFNELQLFYQCIAFTK